jgi:hypothetical protein
LISDDIANACILLAEAALETGHEPMDDLEYQVVSEVPYNPDYEDKDGGDSPHAEEMGSDRTGLDEACRVAFIG